jgi:transcriptional regulator with XRE-family HTH domain
MPGQALSMPARRKSAPRWVMIPGALRQLRAERGQTQLELARRAGLDVTTIRDFEAGCDRSPTEDTLDRLADALKFERERFAYFDEDPGGDGLRRAQLAARVKPPAPGPPMPELVRTGAGDKLARLEGELGLDKATVELGGEDYLLMGYLHLHQCQTLYGSIKRPYVVAGTVREVQSIPSDAADLLNAEQGLGAAYVRIRRDISAVDSHGDPIPFETTVYAPKAAHGRRLDACFLDGTQVKVIVHVFVRPSTETRRELPWLSVPVVHRPWALVATQVYTDKD